MFCGSHVLARETHDKIKANLQIPFAFKYFPSNSPVAVAKSQQKKKPKIRAEHFPARVEEFVDTTSSTRHSKYIHKTLSHAATTAAATKQQSAVVNFILFYVASKTR